MPSKWKVGVVVGVGVLTLTGGAVFAWWLTPPPMPTTLEEAHAIMKSSKFQKLNDTEKRPYNERIRELWGSLDDDERRAMRDRVREDEELQKASRDMMQQMMVDMARKYALATPEEKDEMLDNMTSRWGGGRPRSANRSEQSDPEREKRREQRRSSMMERMGERLSKGNPQHQAYMGEFFRDLRERREAQK